MHRANRSSTNRGDSLLDPMPRPPVSYWQGRLPPTGPQTQLPRKARSGVCRSRRSKDPARPASSNHLTALRQPPFILNGPRRPVREGVLKDLCQKPTRLGSGNPLLFPPINLESGSSKINSFRELIISLGEMIFLRWESLSRCTFIRLANPHNLEVG